MFDDAQVHMQLPLTIQVLSHYRYTIEASSLDLYTDSNARQRSPDCMADDVTAMQSQYATSSEIALQPYATDQSIAEGALFSFSDRGLFIANFVSIG